MARITNTAKDTLLVSMGFEKVAKNQYNHTHYGYLFLRDEDGYKDICGAIFRLGRESKKDEIKKALGF